MSARWRFLPCPDCCDCSYFTDEFNRADSTDLGSDWDERAGVWRILNQMLRADSANGLIVCQQQHPSGSLSYHVFARFRFRNDGDEARVVVDYVDDNNYVFAQIKQGSAADGLSLWKRTNGTNAEVGTRLGNYVFPVDFEFECHLCVHDGEITASVGYRSVSAAHTASSNLTGLGTGAIGPDGCDFTKFDLQYDRSDESDCLPCDPTFCPHFDLTPLEVQITFQGVSGASCCNDFSSAFIASYVPEPGWDFCNWKYAGIPCDQYGGFINVTFGTDVYGDTRWQVTCTWRNGFAINFVRWRSNPVVVPASCASLGPQTCFLYDQFGTLPCTFAGDCVVSIPAGAC